ncbi:MAG TPA: aldo/keto reductase [Chloroflexota bacterium]|nr:aldo/keto reductase [Chloroflexota bacterium]
MQYRTLGRTGIRVSLLGLGSGGMSRLGQRYEFSALESEGLVRHALDAGVNLIDTAPGYGRSEELLGQALLGVPREQYVLCTKFQPHAPGDRQFYAASDLRASLEASLRALRTEFVDVFYLHGIAPAAYAEVCERFLPELTAARDAGLIRQIGITERYQSDHAHVMLRRAIEDGVFSVVMVGFNLMSPAAVTSILPLAAEWGVGVVVMCAVRSVLVNPSEVEAYVRQWESEGLLEPGLVPPDAALDWLLDEHTPTVASAAYKFAAAHPAVGSVLTGTATLDHFEANRAAVLGEPLPVDKVQRVLSVFGPVQRNVQPARIPRLVD